MTRSPFPPDPNKRSVTRNLGYSLTSFIRSFTLMLYVGMGVALLGLVLKLLGVGVGGFIFVFSMALLSLLFMVQVGLSFFYVVSDWRLTLLGALSSVTLTLGFVAMVFRYQNRPGRQVLFLIGLPLFLLTAIFIGMHLAKRSVPEERHRKFLYNNLLLPYLFILALGIGSLFINTERLTPRGDSNLEESAAEAEADADTTGMWRAY